MTKGGVQKKTALQRSKSQSELKIFLDDMSHGHTPEGDADAFQQVPRHTPITSPTLFSLPGPQKKNDERKATSDLPRQLSHFHHLAFFPLLFIFLPGGLPPSDGRGYRNNMCEMPQGPRGQLECNSLMCAPNQWRCFKFKLCPLLMLI